MQYTQDSPDDTWVIPHGLDDYPIIQAYSDNRGLLVRLWPLNITYIDRNTCSVRFKTKVAGVAVLT